DITDRFDSRTNMWGSSERCLDKNLKNSPQNLTDKPDKTDNGVLLSGLSGSFQDHSDKFLTSSFDHSSFLYDFEERLAIAEYDGCQTPQQAYGIAYLDAFLTILFDL